MEENVYSKNPLSDSAQKAAHRLADFLSGKYLEVKISEQLAAMDTHQKQLSRYEKGSSFYACWKRISSNWQATFGTPDQPISDVQNRIRIAQGYEICHEEFPNYVQDGTNPSTNNQLSMNGKLMRFNRPHMSAAAWTKYYEDEKKQLESWNAYDRSGLSASDHLRQLNPELCHEDIQRRNNLIASIEVLLHEHNNTPYEEVKEKQSNLPAQDKYLSAWDEAIVAAKGFVNSKRDCSNLFSRMAGKAPQWSRQKDGTYIPYEYDDEKEYYRTLLMLEDRPKYETLFERLRCLRVVADTTGKPKCEEKR